MFLYIFIFFLFFSCSGKQVVKETIVPAEEAYFEEILQEKEKEAKFINILVLPFEYTGDKKFLAKAEVNRDIIFNSFYTFLSTIPSLKVPHKSVLTKIFIDDEKKLSEVAEKYDCEFIVYGDFTLEGKTRQKALINLKIWNRKSKKIITNFIDTPTDINLFDKIDEMMDYLLGVILEEKIKIAYLTLNITQIKKEKIGVYINNFLVSEVEDANYSASFKATSESKYKISVRRSSTGSEITNIVFKLSPGERKDIFITNHRVNLLNNGDFENLKVIKYYSYNAGMIQNVLKEVGGKWHFIKRIPNVYGISKFGMFYLAGAPNRKPWDFQLVYLPVILKRGRVYRISFDAKATKPQSIYLNICKVGTRNYESIESPEGTDWIFYFHKEIPITKELRTYTYLFKTKKDTDEKTRLQFDLGGSIGDVIIDNVWLEEE